MLLGLKVLTKYGSIEISAFEGQSVEIWNGFEWSKVDIVKTGENQRLLKVETSCGKIECTPYHKWYIEDEFGITVKGQLS